MKILQYTALSALLLMTFIACNHNSKSQDLLLQKIDSKAVDLGVVQSKQEEQNGFSDSIGFQNQPPKNPNGKKNSPVKPDWEKKIIKTADLNLEIKDYNIYSDQLHEIVKQFGGYVAREEQNQSTYQISNAVVIKVPVDQFDDAVTQLIAGNKQLIEKKISSDDVTSEIVDTKSRMEAKKHVKQRYLDLLSQAKNMEEILQVQNEINQIQEQIESATGRMEYLNHSAVFSTIHLTFFQVLDAGAKDIQEPTYFYQVKEAFRNGWKWAIEIFIGLLNIWPLLILILCVWFAFRKWKMTRVPAKTQ